MSQQELVAFWAELCVYSIRSNSSETLSELVLLEQKGTCAKHACENPKQALWTPKTRCAKAIKADVALTEYLQQWFSFSADAPAGFAVRYISRRRLLTAAHFFDTKMCAEEEQSPLKKKKSTIRKWSINCFCSVWKRFRNKEKKTRNTFVWANASPASDVSQQHILVAASRNLLSTTLLMKAKISADSVRELWFGFCARLAWWCAAEGFSFSFLLLLSLLVRHQRGVRYRERLMYTACWSSLFLSVSVGRLAFAMGHECDLVKFAVLVICSGLEAAP